MASSNVELTDLIVFVSGKYTFYGVLKDFYREIFRNVKKETTESSYNSDYNRVILPEMTKEKPIESYTLEDYEGIISRIREKGKYSESTIIRYRYLIRAVVRLAAEKGLCEDVLYGSEFSISPSETPERAAKKELVTNRKSLSVREDTMLYKELMTEPMQSGERMGLALMYCLGLRNEEACGLRYDAIRRMNLYPDCYYAQVYQSINSETGEVHIGGKTPNMYRLIPIPDRLYWLIHERARQLRQTLGDAVDKCCIACQGDKYELPCLSRHLTAAGRLLLRKIHVNEDVVSYIDRELHRDAKAMGLREKDPTTYLLRRNLGTHLYFLGLDEAEIQYIMGHGIEDPYIIRNHYENEELLYGIHRKMKNRPLLNDSYPYETVVGINSGHCYHEVSSEPEVQLSVSPNKQSVLQLSLSCDEPCASIEIDAKSAVKMQLIEVPPHTRKISRRSNIIETYHNTYKKAVAQSQRQK